MCWGKFVTIVTVVLSKLLIVSTCGAWPDWVVSVISASEGSPVSKLINSGLVLVNSEL